MMKNLLAMQETWVRSLGWEDPLEKEMATHSSFLAWRIPMDRGAWWATYSQRSCKESEMAEWLSTAKLINSVVIVSGGQQRDSAIHVSMYKYPFSPKFPYHPGCHITLSRVPCALQ